MCSFHKPNPLKASQGLNKKIGYLQTQNLGTKIIYFFKFSKLQRKKEKNAKKLIQRKLSILPADPAS